MNNERHPCRYIDCTLEHDGSWVDGKWYEWEDIYGNREVARMKLDAMDHFYPNTKIIKEENVRRYREIMEGENYASGPVGRLAGSPGSGNQGREHRNPGKGRETDSQNQ